MTLKNRVKVERLLDGAEITRGRADRVLYQADLLTGQGVEIVTRNRANIERTLSNVKDATDWADKLVQKIFANPFVLSPFYKPTPEDTRVQTVYDTAQASLHQGGPGTERPDEDTGSHESQGSDPLTQQQELAQIERQIMIVTEQLL